jgi:cell division protein FtsL
MPTTICERRSKPNVTADRSERLSSLEKASYFSVVSWLSVLGAAIAVVLVATYPTMADMMWLFSQVP